MKYRLLKQIEKEGSISIGDTFDCGEFLSVDNPECEIPVKILIDGGYIEEVKTNIPDPKFVVGEKVIWESKGCIFFTEIKGIRILDGEVMYYLFDGFYNESNIKSAILESTDRKSKFFNIYPF